MLDRLLWHPDFMLNSHPLVVHFPIALWTAPLILGALWLVFRKPALETATWATLALGVALAVVTAVTGLRAADTVPHPEAAHELLEEHETMAFVSAGLAAALAALRLFLWQRLRSIRLAFPVGLVALAVLVNYTAHLGGEMVYRYGIGTTAVRFPSESSHEEERVSGQGHEH